jgi:hypothetical protein
MMSFDLWKIALPSTLFLKVKHCLAKSNSNNSFVSLFEKVLKLELGYGSGLNKFYTKKVPVGLVR